MHKISSLLILLIMGIQFSYASPTYRTVKLIIKNDTKQALVLEDYAAVMGGWEGKAPSQFTIQPGRIMITGTASSSIGIGTAGFVRLISAEDILSINWNLPWAGPLRYQTQTTKNILHLSTTNEEEDPDNPVLMIRIHDQLS